jgi:serine/threonine protein kinase
MRCVKLGAMGTLTVSVPAAEERSRAEADAHLRSGTRLGRYELLRLIATGGMAHVWVARQRGEFGFARTVAIKVIRPEQARNATFRRMFLDEARLAAGISHPNVIHVLDLGEQDDVVFLAMELVEGATLAQLLGWGAAGEPEALTRLPPGIVARIVAEMAAGLHAAHELTDEGGTPLHLVHRDVSPQNILVSLDGVAKIADFGIAKAFGRRTAETEAGQVKGKWSYLSPEQIRREPLDRRSDVFSAGIVLWEALAGRRLFRGEDVLDTVERVKGAPIPDPCAIAPDVPAGLAQVALKALERDPVRRFQTAAELSDALEEAARGAGVTSTGKQLGEFVAARAGGDVSDRRAAIADAATALDATADPRPTKDTLRPARRAIGWGLGAAAVALIVGAGAVATGRVMSPRVSVSPTPSTSLAPSPPPVDPPAAESAAAVPPSATDDAKNHANPHSKPEPLHAPPRRPRAAPAASSQRLPFTNPYQP